MDLKSLVPQVEAKSIWIRNTLREFVLQESPSEDKALVDNAMAMAQRYAISLGGRAKRHKQKIFGDVLELRFGPARSVHKPLLLLGHMDTVWPVGTLASMPWREDDGRYW